MNILALSKQDFDKRFKGKTITYGVAQTAYGPVFMSLIDKYIVGLGFTDKATPQILPEHPHKNRDDKSIQPIVSSILDRKKVSFDLLIIGTPFQIKAWEALYKVPYGKTSCYEEMAKQIGNPKAVRAVANAFAKNAISYLIPCHRILRKAGGFGGYRWGVDLKKKLLREEGHEA